MLAQSSGLKLKHKFNTIAFACLSAVSSSTVTCRTEHFNRKTFLVYVCVCEKDGVFVHPQYIFESYLLFAVHCLGQLEPHNLQ